MSGSKTTTALRRAASRLPLDAKRTPSRKCGIENWYPYYAGFSTKFAREVLETARLPDGANVLDPWNGSGTTTFVADRLGLSGIGYDINPVAVLIATAKLALPQDAQHIVGLARRVAAEATEQISKDNKPDPLHAWLRPNIVNQYREIEARILADLATGSNRQTLSPALGQLPPLASFLILSLMRTARNFAAVKITSNPTWVRPGAAPCGTRHAFANAWLQMVDRMALELSVEIAQRTTTTRTALGDARNLPLANEEVDFVLTSPPYCTRIDYTVSTSFELAALGLSTTDSKFLSLRRDSMGTPLTRGETPFDIPSEWPRSIRILLQAIRKHPSKASSSYYYKTYWQYFSDTFSAISELHRTLRHEGAAVLVLQSSYYKEIHIDLPKLYLDVAKIIGLRGQIISEVPVRRTLVQINTLSSRHSKPNPYKESTLVLQKR